MLKPISSSEERDSTTPTFPLQGATPEQLHYADVAEAYESTWLYAGESPYTLWMKDQIKELLALEKSHKLVDLGAGTGNFTAALAAEVGLEQRAICVEPSAPMLAKAESKPGLEPLLGTGQDLVARGDSLSYDRLLLKEVVHHIPVADLPAFATGIFSQLTPGGITLICTRPHDPSHLPFFPAALDVWREHQDHSDVYVKPLEDAGFDVTVIPRPFPVALSKAEFLRMVRSRYWSTFSMFSGEELEAGLAELEPKLEDPVKFDDILLFIVASKPSSESS